MEKPRTRKPAEPYDEADFQREKEARLREEELRGPHIHFLTKPKEEDETETPLSETPHRLLPRRAETPNHRPKLIKRRRPVSPFNPFPFPSDELEAKRKQLDGLKKDKKEKFGFWLRLDKILPKLFDPWTFYLLLILIDALKKGESILKKKGQKEFDGWFSLDQGEIKKVCPFFSKERLQTARRKLEKAGILVVERKLRIGTSYLKKNLYWIDFHHLCSLIDSLIGDQNE